MESRKTIEYIKIFGTIFSDDTSLIKIRLIFAFSTVALQQIKNEGLPNLRLYCFHRIRIGLKQIGIIIVETNASTRISMIFLMRKN